MQKVNADLVFLEDGPWHWRRVGGGFRHNVTGSTTQVPPAGVLEYWLRKAIMLLEKKFESLDKDKSGTLNINELVTSATSDTVKKTLRDLFKEASLQSSGELNFSEFFALLFNWCLKNTKVGLQYFFPAEGTQYDTNAMDQESLLEGFQHLVDLVNKGNDGTPTFDFDSVQTMLQQLFPDNQNLISIVLARNFTSKREPLRRLRYFLMITYDIFSMIPGSGITGSYITTTEGYSAAANKDWKGSGQHAIIEETLIIFEHRFAELSKLVDGDKRLIRFDVLLEPGKLWMSEQDRDQFEKRIDAEKHERNKALDFAEFFALLHSWATRKHDVLKCFFSSPSNRSVIRLAFSILSSWLDRYGIKKDGQPPRVSKADVDRIVSSSFRGQRNKNFAQVSKRHFPTEDFELDLAKLWTLLYDLFCSVDGSAIKGTYLLSEEQYIAPTFLDQSPSFEWIGEGIKVLERRFAEFDVDGSKTVRTDELAQGLPIGYEDRKMLKSALGSGSMTFPKFVRAVHAANDEVMSLIFPSAANQEAIRMLFQQYAEYADIQPERDPGTAFPRVFEESGSATRCYLSVKKRHIVPIDVPTVQGQALDIEAFTMLLYNVMSMERTDVSGVHLEVEIFPLCEAFRRLEQYFSKHSRFGKRISDFKQRVAGEFKEKFEALFPTKERDMNEDFSFAEFLAGIFKWASQTDDDTRIKEIEFLFRDKADPKNKPDVCAQSIADLGKLCVDKILQSLGPATAATTLDQVWGYFNDSMDEDNRAKHMHAILRDLFPRYQGYFSLEKTSEILRKLNKDENMSSRQFCNFLYHVQCEAGDKGLDATIKLQRTYKRVAESIEMQATKEKMKINFNDELTAKTGKVRGLQSKVNELRHKHDTIRKEDFENETVRKTLEKDCDELESKIKEFKGPKLGDDVGEEVDELGDDVGKKVDDSELELEKKELEIEVENLKKAVGEMMKERNDRMEERRQEQAGIKTKTAKKAAFTARLTLVKPDEQLDNNDRDMIDSLVRNPGVGAFTMGFIIAYYGISFGRSTVASLAADYLEDEDQKNFVTTFVGGSEPAGNGGDPNSPDPNSARVVPKSKVIKTISSVVEKIIDRLHVAFAVLVSCMLPTIMLVVQFASVYLIFNEADEHYSQGFCPGYDVISKGFMMQSTALVKIRAMMVFVGIYFVAKTFSQAVLYFRALTERSADQAGLSKPHVSVVRSMFGMCFGTLASVCGSKASSGGAETKANTHQTIESHRHKCVTSECLRQAMFYFEADNSTPAITAKSEQAKTTANKQQVAETSTPTRDNTTAAITPESEQLNSTPDKQQIAKTSTNAQVDSTPEVEQANATAGTQSEKKKDPTLCATCAAKMHAKTRPNEIAKFELKRQCDFAGCNETGCYGLLGLLGSDKAEPDAFILKEGKIEERNKEPEDFRFCRAHAVSGCAHLQHHRATESSKTFLAHSAAISFPKANLCCPPEYYHVCDMEGCYLPATSTMRPVKVDKLTALNGNEKYCDKHAEDRAYYAQTCLDEQSGRHLHRAVYPMWMHKDRLEKAERPLAKKKLSLPFLRKNLWRDVQDSAIYPLFCIDVCVNLALVYSVLLGNLYIIFTEGSSVQDILAKLVILDFIYLQQGIIKREMLQGSRGKTFLEGIKGAYNMPGDIHVNSFYSTIFANILYLLNFLPFLVSAAMIVYGPLCKPSVVTSSYAKFKKFGVK